MENELAPTPTRKPVNKGYLIIAVIAAIGLLYLALKDISWNEVWLGIRQARLEYYALTILLGATTIYLRGLRWGVLLSAQKKIDHLTMLWATSIGYLGNLLLPARAGEVIRSVMLGSKANISKSYVFATAITERILDVIILVLVGVFSIPTIGGLPEFDEPGFTSDGIFRGCSLVVPNSGSPFLTPYSSFHALVTAA